MDISKKIGKYLEKSCQIGRKLYMIIWLILVMSLNRK